MRSAYFPIDRRLHREREREREREKREREREREREKQERERLCPSVKWWKHGNGTISVIWDLHISLLIGDCIEIEREAMSICEMVKTQKWYYLHHTRSAYFPINTRLHISQYDIQWSMIMGVDLPNLNSSSPLDVSPGGRSAISSWVISAKFELIFTTRCQSWGLDLLADLGLYLPILNSSWPLDVSTGS